MLVCWLRDKDDGRLVSMSMEEGWIISMEEIAKTRARFANLCYGAYDGDELIGGVTGYLHEKSAWIGNLIIKSDFRGRGIGRKLLETILKALSTERRIIYLHSAMNATKFYEKLGFKAVTDVVRYRYEANEHCEKEKSFLAEYQRSDTRAILQTFDRNFFAEDRTEFLLEDMSSKSSLFLSCQNGFCHSKAVGKDIVIGAWEMVGGAYLDAEKMLRTTISIRGQKNIYADLPENNLDVKAIYENYGFKQVGKTRVMALGEPLKVKYENIFAFASLGSKG